MRSGQAVGYEFPSGLRVLEAPSTDGLRGACNILNWFFANRRAVQWKKGDQIAREKTRCGNERVGSMTVRRLIMSA